MSYPLRSESLLDIYEIPGDAAGAGTVEARNARLSVTSSVDERRWEDFIARSLDATAYHSYRWKKVIEESFGHRGHYLAALDGRGKVRGVLPLVHMKSRLFGNFLISVPFVNYGGLLCESAEAEQVLLQEADALRGKLGAGHVELRHLDRPLGELPGNRHKVTMVLPLAATVEEQWTAFNAKLRNQIRKAEKNSLHCTVGEIELLDDFYAIFARNMRDLGTPVYGKSFFRNVLAAFPETTRIFVVTLEGKAIAAGIASWFRETIEMPWASSISEYKALCPNNMLYWEAISFAIERGFKSFDFGRSTPNEGTFNFKKQWGAQPVQLHWQYLLDGGEIPALNNKNPKYQLAIRLWKRLPVPLTRLVGPSIVRNIP
jgi:serine/alanine adding enzyme